MQEFQERELFADIDIVADCSGVDIKGRSTLIVYHTPYSIIRSYLSLVLHRVMDWKQSCCSQYHSLMYDQFKYPEAVNHLKETIIALLEWMVRRFVDHYHYAVIIIKVACFAVHPYAELLVCMGVCDRLDTAVESSTWAYHLHVIMTKLGLVIGTDRDLPLTSTKLLSLKEMNE